VTVVGGTAPKVRDGWMWDLTVPGNDDHDFYVEAATAVVLVHNCVAPRKGGGANDAPSWVSREAGSPQPGENAQQYATRILNDKYGEGNWPKGAGSEFSKIVKWVTPGREAELRWHLWNLNRFTCCGIRTSWRTGSLTRSSLVCIQPKKEPRDG
jgi:hypothetical protein